MKKILTVGVFDYFHIGHLRLFHQCKRYADYLIVAVQDSDYVLKYKPSAKMLYSTEERIEIVKALRVVDEVRVYQDIDSFIVEIEFDTFAIGEDQNHLGFQKAIKWCREHRKNVVRLNRTPNISSTSIKDTVETDIERIFG